jgi:hypothetical protein
VADFITVTREELYEQVWATPMRTVAGRYGISDVALAKTCRRLGVPVPGRGYWARKTAGQHVRRVPLPNLRPDALRGEREFTFDPSRAERRQRALLGRVAAQTAYEREPTNAIRIPERLTAVHPLVRTTFRALRDSKAHDDGVLYPPDKRMLDVSVARSTLPRARRVMDAVVKAFSKRGWLLADPTGDEAHVVVVVEGQRAPFSLSECTKKLPPVPPKPILIGRGEFYTPSWAPTKYEPTGDLVLELGASWGSGSRRRWRDGKRQRVEDCLNDFMIGIMAFAEEAREFKHAQAQRMRELEEAQQRWIEHQRRVAEEAARIKTLEGAAAAWNRSRNLLEFVAALRKVAEDKLKGDPLSEPFTKWIEWAEGYAISIDPLSNRLTDLLTRSSQ